VLLDFACVCVCCSYIFTSRLAGRGIVNIVVDFVFRI
jgi:hypothetical protein